MQGKTEKKCLFSDFRAVFYFRAERKRSQAELSRAENPLAQAMARASSARTHH